MLFRSLRFGWAIGLVSFLGLALLIAICLRLIISDTVASGIAAPALLLELLRAQVSGDLMDAVAIALLAGFVVLSINAGGSSLQPSRKAVGSPS